MNARGEILLGLVVMLGLMSSIVVWSVPVTKGHRTQNPCALQSPSDQLHHPCTTHVRQTKRK
jgi:hypothetical protein